jgi:hypothetical protein
MIAADMQRVVRRRFFISFESVIDDELMSQDGIAICMAERSYERDFSLQWIKIKFLYK